MNYNEIILKDLMSIYERRDSRSSNFRTSVKIKLSKSKYPKYFDNQSEFDNAISELNTKQFIKLKHVPHDTVVDSIILNLDKVEEIKTILNIDSISDRYMFLLNELNKYSDEIILKLKKEITGKRLNNKSIKQYLSTEYIDAIKAVHFIENLESETYERNLSNKIFKDSKRLSKLKTLIISIYNNENIFIEKGINNVPPYIYVKGSGTININNQIIDLEKVNTTLGFPIDDCKTITFENISKVTTIENLTTFYDYSSDGLIVYLGGFSTKSQLNILNKLKTICSNFYHFGDIDLGGLTILNNLIDELQIEVKTINMDLKTLKENISLTQSINDDRYIEKMKRLLLIKNLEPYYDVIEYIIENKVWLEQESFYTL